MEQHKQARKQKTWIPTDALGNNIDLLTGILLRLPAKSLIRFKCVSKQWLSLISDPQFCLSYTRHHHSPCPTPTALLLRNIYTQSPEFQIVPLKHDTIPKVPFFDYLDVPSIFIYQSCNGLLLCLANSYNLKSEPEHNYYICNPTIKQFRRLSFPGFEFKESLLSICMAFDPLKSNHYKLICVCKVEKADRYKIVMYSSETDSWSPLGITFTPPNRIDFAKRVFCNGAVHWYSNGETSLYFDVGRECLNTMLMPNLVVQNFQYFGESRGHLHLIVTKWRTPLQLDVLEMAEDYSGWFVMYHVNIDTMRNIENSENRHRVFSVLNIIRAKKEEDSIVVVFMENKAISYNVHDGTSKKLHSSNYTLLNTFEYFDILTFV